MSKTKSKAPSTTPVESKQKAKGLSPKRREFIRQYLIDGNATRAAIAAGYSAKNADSIAVRLVRKSQVKAALDKEYARRKVEFDIDEKRIIRELAAIAFGHVGMVATWDDKDMKPIPKKKMNEQAMKFLASIEKITLGPGVVKTTVTTMASQKVKALEALGKHIGMWSNDGKGTDPGDKSAVLDRISEYLRKKQEQ